MLTPINKESLPENKFSKQFIDFTCSCGNPEIIKVRWLSYATGNSRTCGSCPLFRWVNEGVRKYGKLTLKTDVKDITKLTQNVEWECNCGKTKKVSITRVVSGNTKSCGCNYFGPRPGRSRTDPKKSKEEWLAEYPRLVQDEGLPSSWTRGSRLEIKCLCKCGKLFQRPFHNFTKSQKCGRCTEIEIVRGTEVNGFIYDDEDELIKTDAQAKKFFICKCGNRKEISCRYIFSGTQKSCGRCSEKLIDQSHKFGKLRIKNPKRYTKFSTIKETWVCDCGNETEAVVSNVLNGVTKSCGNCRKNVADWFIKNEEILRNLKCPIEINGLPPGGVVPLERFLNSKMVFRAQCPACGNEYKPRFEGLRLGVSLTCGCTSNRISSGHQEIFYYLESLGLSPKLEHPLCGYKYDLFIQSKNLLIEYNGLKWHSMPRSKEHDINKYKIALKSGFDYIMIYEDEWVFNAPKVKSLLLNRLGLTQFQRIRPNKCEIRKIENSVADEFYDKNHYIGACRSNMNYGAVFNDELVSCMSFKTPTRQSSYDFELVRMASDSKYRVVGIWSKLLNKFVLEHNIGSIVSFSDNRLFHGNVYEKIGFKFDGEVRPSYYWTKGQKRYHQSALRKPDGSELTENELRTMEGYKKIWDLGKKRWVYKIYKPIV